MNVSIFDIEKGIYRSSLPEIDTEWHSHPAIELVYSASNGLIIDIEGGRTKNVRLAVLDSNVRHRVGAECGEVVIFMIEYRDYSVRSILGKNNIFFNGGVYVETQKSTDFEHLIADLVEHADTEGYDSRVSTAISWLKTNDVSYAQLIGKLLNEVYLSESRLAHLFKADTGVSLKRYLVWCKLKRTIAAHLHKELDLYSAMIHSGFYDQAHFSKSYKSLIGISPSKVYK